MQRSAGKRFRAWVVLGVLVQAAASGCSSNSNEAEYLRNTSPGTPAEPESVSSRRERTKSVSTAPAKGAKTQRRPGG